MTAADTPIAVDDMLRDLGRTLTRRRERCGMTRAELATRANYSYGTVLSAEHGQRTSSRRFWSATDAALRANGTLVAAADAVSLRVAAAKRQQATDHGEPAAATPPPLAPYRRVQRTNRAFADRLSTLAARRRRHPHMVETIARPLARIRSEEREV